MDNLENKGNKSDDNGQTLTEKYQENMSKKLKILKNKISNLFFKYKKQILIVLTFCVVFLISIILFNILYDFTKISWDKDYVDVNLEYTQATTLELNVLAYDKEGNAITDIKFSSDDGKIVNDGTKVQWELPEEEGSYVITALAPSGKKITKKIEVIILEGSSMQPLKLKWLEEPEVDDTIVDNDEDGFTNAVEQELGTNPNSKDTDKDGISDYDEVKKSKTDPLKFDTDEDGLSDGNELDLGFDPLKDDSKNDGIKDGQRNLTYTILEKDLGVNLEINGKGNIATTTIDINFNSSFEEKDGILNKLYNFYTDGTINNAIVEIDYNLVELKEKGLEEDNLTLYYFNESTKELEQIETVVDKVNKTITANLEHFSIYVIGDKEVVIESIETDMLFVIDNSISMYTNEQMEDAGVSATGAVGNDKEFKRLILTNNMINMLTGNYKYSIAEFSGNYVNLNEFTSDKDITETSVNSMESKWNSNYNGTDIVEALEEGIVEFSEKEENNNYLILLTDGKDTEEKLTSNKDAIIEKAKNNNVSICVIGLGSNVDTEDLNYIALETGCDYYNATDTNALDEIYSIIGSNINYNYIDTDGDDIVDGMITDDSGFIVTNDGFGFNNFGSNKSPGGNCYGMAAFSMLYYTKELPNSLDSINMENNIYQFPAANSYDLTDTYFETGNDLYNFEIITEPLNYFVNNIPNDFRDRVESDILMINETYYDKLENIGSTFSVKDYTYKNDSFSKYQDALLNLDSEKFAKNVTNDELQIFNSIYRLFVLQVDHETISFGANPDNAFEQLKQNLSTGTPIILGLRNNGAHAVNAIKLIQDIEDSNNFKIAIYDNNFPGETRYIEVIRSKNSKWSSDTGNNEDSYNYTFMYDIDYNNILDEVALELAFPNVK